MRRVFPIGIALSALLAVSPRPADACTCTRDAGGCGAAADYWRTDAVFLGRVEAVEPVSRKVAQRLFPARRVRLKVTESFRGTAGPGAEVVIVTGSGGGDCGFPFKVGLDYLVYANSGGPNGTLTTGICSRTRTAANAAADVEYARAAAAGRAPAGRIIGRVVLERWDLAGTRRSPPRGLPGVTVLLTRDGDTMRAVTDAEGNYSIEGLAAGEYAVAAELPDAYYTRHNPTVALADSRACAEGNFTVLPNGRVSGRVVDAQGRAVAGLTIDLTEPGRSERSGWPQQVRAVTEADGTYELVHIPPGRFVVGINTQPEEDGRPSGPRVFLPGVEKVADARILTIGPGERIVTDDLVVPAHIEYVRIAGTVIGVDGWTAADAFVFLKSDAENGYILGEPVTTDASGRFVLAARARGRYRVFAERHAKGATLTEMDSSDPVTLTASPDLPPVRLVLRRRY